LLIAPSLSQVFLWVLNNPNHPLVQWGIKALLNLVSHVSPEMAAAGTAVAISVVGLVLVLWKRKTLPGGELEIEERKRLVVGETFEAVEVHRRVRLTLPERKE